MNNVTATFTYTDNLIKTLGGAFYINTGNVNVEYSVFLNNTCSYDNVSNTIYAPSLVTADTNWWGNNTPDFTNTNLIISNSQTFTPKNYVILNLSVNPSTINVDESTNIIVKYQTNTSDNIEDLVGDLPSRNLTLTINEQTMNILLSNNVSKKFTPSSVGTYSISATVDNQPLNSIVNVQDTPVIKGDDLNLDLGYGTGQTVTVKLVDSTGKGISGQTLSYVFNGGTSTSVSTGTDGTYAIPITDGLTTGTYTLTVSYAGNEIYKAATDKTIKVKVLIPTSITSGSDSYNFDVGTGGTVTVKLVDNSNTGVSGQTIKYKFDSDSDYTTVSGTTGADGSINIPISKDLSVGSHSLTIAFDANGNYKATSKIISIIVLNPIPPVSPIVTVISGEDIVTNLSSVNFTVTLKTVDGDNLAGENVLFIYYNGEYHPVTTDKDGVASVTLTGLSLGSYNIRYVYNGNNLYAGSSGSNTILVTNFMGTSLSISNYTNLFGVKGNLTGRLLDVNGNPLVNQTVSLNLSRLSDNLSKVYNVSTDSNGVYYLEINLNTGDYSVSALYNSKTVGNITYTSCGPVNASIVIFNQTSEMGTNLTVEDYSGLVSIPGNLTGRLTDINGKALSGQSILLDIQGIDNNLRLINTSTTDSDGYYNLKLDLPVGEYIVFVNYNQTRIGNITYLSSGPVNASIKVYNETIDTNTVLSLNNLIESYGEALNLTGTLLDLNGNPVIGMHISLNLTRLSDGASKIYHATTDNKGEYQLEINLYPGEYTVSASFNGLKTNTTNYLASGPVNSTINVNKVGSVLTADKFQAKYGANQNFTGKLVNSNGQAVIGQHISLKLIRLSDGASKVYYATTDTNGEYQLPINLFKGEYTAECTYTGTSIYTGSDASTSLSVI